jgi:hypothetical protein
MDAKTYCDTLIFELVGWKARIFDTVRRLDNLPRNDKKKVLPEVNDLHRTLEDLERRIEDLRTRCPEEWESEKHGLDDQLSILRSMWEQTENNMSIWTGY